MAASISFCVPEQVSPEMHYIIEMKCKLLKKVLEEDRRSKILEKLKEKKSKLQNILDIEKKELNNKTKILEQISNQRKAYDLEKDIENTISINYLKSETDESLEHHPKDLISSIKAVRSKLDIYNVSINSEDQLNELIIETKLKLEEFQENEGNVINEVALAKDLPLLNGYLNESYAAQKKCVEVVDLVERLTLHAQALAKASVKIDISKD